MTEVSNRSTYRSPECQFCGSRTVVTRWIENSSLDATTSTWLAMRRCTNAACEAGQDSLGAPQP